MASSMFCGAALAVAAGAPALAQTATPSQPAAAATGGSEVAEIVVTGTRIPQPNLNSVSPVQVVGSQEVLLGGRPATIDILNQLPQVTQNASVDLGPTSNPLSGPGGVATVDLRGLGPQRTLVLVDGRRLGLGDPNTGNPNPAPDINQVPSQLINRVEVLTGGASAVYGSDAVAGVVNFVMKHNFEGAQIDAQWGVYQHSQHNDLMQGLANAKNIHNPGSEWDGKSRDLSLLFGMNAPDNKGNITAYFTYHDQDPVTDAHRDYAACQLNVDPNPRCAGSSNSNIFYLASGAPFTIGGQSADAGAVLGNQFVPYGTPGTSPPAEYNSNNLEYLIQQSTRYTAGFFANYQINDHVELYSDFNFMNDRTNVQIAPSALFQGSGAQPSGGFLVNCNNPFLSAQQQGVLGCSAGDIASGATRDLYIGRRNVEGGPRNSFYEHTNYRVVGGARGTITGPWKYDVYGSYYRTTLASAVQNYLSIAGIQDALLVGGTAANPVCLSGRAGCVPYNIFQDNGVTSAAAQSLAELGTSRGTTTERIFEADVTGDLSSYGIKSPWARDGVGVAFGVTQRRDHLEFAPDVAEESGDLSGSGGASVRVNNSLRAAEVYGEVRVPLVQDMPFARDVLFEGGYRYSDYSTGIQAKTWKVGLQWSPIEDIRFRGSFNRAIRAPNILELYSPQTVTNTSQVSEDPCAANAVNPASPAACLNTGITAAQYGVIPQCPAQQCAVLTGGNPALQPERANTFTVGFTTRPHWVRGLTASIDYFHIDLKDEIGSIPLGVVLQRCLDTGAQNFCSQIVRNPVNGTLFGTSQAAGGYINGTGVNIGQAVTSGVDVQASYNLPLADWGIDNWGGLSFELTGSYLLKASTVPLPGDPSYDCAGLFGPQCGSTVNPRWRHTLRVNWTTPWHDLLLSAAWRYIGESKYEVDTNEPSIGKGRTNAFNHTLPERSYIDLAGLWKVNDMFSLRAGVNNVFDQDPPLINSAIVGSGLPNTYPTYDLLGRKVFVGFTANF
ncbi:MAG: TonB-dependent receptor [Caulobacterales bacterium]|nr:TonB-dependent receptor [Caulobacterales bacterium]